MPQTVKGPEMYLDLYKQFKWWRSRDWSQLIIYGGVTLTGIHQPKLSEVLIGLLWQVFCNSGKVTSEAAAPPALEVGTGTSLIGDWVVNKGIQVLIISLDFFSPVVRDFTSPTKEARVASMDSFVPSLTGLDCEGGVVCGVCFNNRDIGTLFWSSETFSWFSKCRDVFCGWRLTASTMTRSIHNWQKNGPKSYM